MYNLYLAPIYSLLLGYSQLQLICNSSITVFIDILDLRDNAENFSYKCDNFVSYVECLNAIRIVIVEFQSNV